MSITPDPDQVKAATQAYIYGYPLVYNLTEIAKLPAGTSLLRTEVPLNTFGAARELLDSDAEFVSPNNDTLYLVAACDLSAGPIVLEVPDTHDRYYVLQFVDAWTNNFAYIGRRATGTAAGKYLLAPAEYTGDAGGLAVLRCPTDIFAIVGRIQVNGHDDLPAVHALQDAFHLTPAPQHTRTLAGLPAGDDRVGDDLAWWERFRVALRRSRPPTPMPPTSRESARSGCSPPTPCSATQTPRSRPHSSPASSREIR